MSLGKIAVPGESREAIQLLITVFPSLCVPDPWEGSYYSPPATQDELFYVLAATRGNSRSNRAVSPMKQTQIPLV